MTGLKDFMDKEFSYEQENYPGSKQARRPPTVTHKDRDPVEWDHTFYKKMYKGVETQFFTLEALCLGLDRPAATIRMWLRKGYIPEAPLRLPEKLGAHGKMQKGRRLYTRAQVESLLEIFERHGIRENTRVKWEQHHPALAIEIAEAWAALRPKPTA